MKLFPLYINIYLSIRKQEWVFLKETIKKIVTVAALTSMAFGFGAGIQSHVFKGETNQAIVIKQPPIYKDPSDF